MDRFYPIGTPGQPWTSSDKTAWLERREVQRILLGGGTAAIPGLRESLAGHTGLEVIMANPFTHMSVNPRVDIQALAGDAPAMLTACGLAMRKRS